MTLNRTIQLRALAAGLAVAALAACSTHGKHGLGPIESASTQIAPGVPKHSQSAYDPRTGGPVAAEPAAPARPLVTQTSSDGAVARPQIRENGAQPGDVTLNYVDADIHEVIRAVLGDILKQNYTIEPGFQGTVTIHTARPLRHDELVPTLQGLLAQLGGTMVYQNGIYQIGAADNDAIVPPLVSSASLTQGSQVVPLRFASAKQLSTMLEPYVGEGAKMIADPARNVLIITGSAAARQSLLDLINVFDVDYLAGRSYALFPVKTGDPSKFVSDLQAALQLDADGPLAGILNIVPIDQANAIMVIAQQPAYLDRAAQLIAQLDKVKESAGRNLHVIYLKNSQATDLQPLLQRAINPPAGGGGGEAAPGGLPPTAQGTELSSAKPESQSGITQTAAATGTSPSAAGGTGATGGSTPAMGLGSMQSGSSYGSTQSGGAEAVAQQLTGAAKGPQIIADAKNNALLVVATESEYSEIDSAVRKLDIMPLQVMVEATVAEVTLNDTLQYGTQFFLSHHDLQGTLSNAQSIVPTVIDPTATTPLTNAGLFPGLLAPAFPGFAIAKTAGTAQFALEALKRVTDVRVISAPKLLILDNQEARLQVGDLVPIITQSATSVASAGAPVVNSVAYQETGVILSVKPRVNSGGLVTLNIEQEVSNVVPTTSSTINSPTFQQRKIESKVVIQDGETISLAGLISDKKQNGVSGIPLLQEIPVLGHLFSTTDNSTDRTELLVLITPHVVYDSGDARALTDELRRKLAPSALAQ